MNRADPESIGLHHQALGLGLGGVSGSQCPRFLPRFKACAITVGMDLGLLGFSGLVLLLVIAAGWSAVRNRAVVDALAAEGFEGTDLFPANVGRLEGLLNARVEEVLVAPAMGKSGARIWLARMAGVDQETASSQAALFAEGLESKAPAFVALAYSGASPAGRLGRIGLRLTEIGNDSLRLRHRLRDRSGVLFSGVHGFVVWGDREADVEDVLPPGVIRLLCDPAFATVQGVMIDDAATALWGPWRHATELIPLMHALSGAVHDGS